MGEKARDIFTIPNALTAGRLIASPYIAKKLHDNPAKWWLPAGAFAASDIMDGFLARLGDDHSNLAEVGFRTSETGRKLDPVTDKIVISEFMGAGMHSGVIPKRLGAAALAQKALVSGVSLVAEAAGQDVHVTKLGKRSELATNVGLGALFIAESIEDQTTKQRVRAAGAVVAAAGITGALVATAQYISQARQ